MDPVQYAPRRMRIHTFKSDGRRALLTVREGDEVDYRVPDRLPMRCAVSEIRNDKLYIVPLTEDGSADINERSRWVGEKRIVGIWRAGRRVDE